jgi:adenine-specific DNA-methyltransferase
MESLGLRILRYTTAEVTRNLSGVLEDIFAATREQVISEAPDRQWRYAGHLKEGDTVFCGLDLQPGRIVTIQREQAVEEVYDLEVEGAHSFLTEVCAVHNCGSGTTAYVAEQWGRRWITIDTSRVAVGLARTRLMSARYPYYLLSDSEEGILKEAEVIGQVPSQPLPRTEGDIRKGFVYKRVPHITLKSIANNEEMDGIHARWQEKLEPVRAKLNEAVGENWEEWEVPREADESWSEGTAKLHQEWWKLRRERQREVDESIARHADTELLYDQPYEDHKRIRVSGPFTVESLSPHRVLATDEERPAAEREAQAEPGPGQFETMIIENLRKAGVQNTVKQERLSFDRLEPFSGAYIQAHGEYTDPSASLRARADKSRRVAVCIGPEHGTVGPDLVKEAAKEALQGVGFDLLLVCGFAFDPHAGEAAKEFRPQTMKGGDFAVVQDERKYGKLPVLLVRINADLSLGEPFLKRTGAGNLFMVFGEPDVELRKDGDGKLVVEIKGVDVYDPTTGEIRSHTTDDIACWFVDTNYDGESFFVRHAYFTGADEPYEKLQRALKAEINEGAWASLYSTTSRPFDPPATGKIAVKVINHYGDEVLKVYEVGGGVP